MTRQQSSRNGKVGSLKFKHLMKQKYHIIRERSAFAPRSSNGVLRSKGKCHGSQITLDANKPDYILRYLILIMISQIHTLRQMKASLCRRCLLT